MQTIEKALHHPMPFTTGGQTITDRLTAAKHSLAGSQLGKTICKATTEELMAPKKKHLDYLLHCTNEPNVSIPSMANLLIERTQNPNWTVVYKSLITIHNIMCYGNERFSQYLASCNTTFNLGNFLDKGSAQGYDMSQHVRRYGKYISEKIYTYRLCAFDFCKVKRGREDGLLRTMSADKLLKTLPILQNQIDALLEFQVTSGELNNGVINCSFILLFRDLIRLFACYNDGIINLLEKYFDMNKKQCREALDMYKTFLQRLEKVADFLKVAETVGIDRGEIPDLTRAPASLLEALEAHLIHLEGGKPLSFPNNEQVASAIGYSAPLFSSEKVDDSMKQKYLEEEKERLRMFEEQRKKQVTNVAGNATVDSQLFNPFAGPTRPADGSQQLLSKPADDLLNLFDSPQPQMVTPVGVSMNTTIQPTMPLDPTNPFAQNVFPQYPPMVNAPSASTAFNAYPQACNSAFAAKFNSNFGNMQKTGTFPIDVHAVTKSQEGGTNPFLMTTSEQWHPSEQITGQQWIADKVEQNMQQHFETKGVMAESNLKGVSTMSGADSSESSEETGEDMAPSDTVNSALHNPFGAMQQNAEALHIAGAGQIVLTPQRMDMPFYPPPSSRSSADNSPVQFDAPHNISSSAPQPIPQPIHQLGIYDQTPFSHTDGSYTSSPVFAHHPQQATANVDAYGSQPPPSASSAVVQQGKFGCGDLDSALSSLADSLSIASKGIANQGKPVQWNNQSGVRPIMPSAVTPAAYGQVPGPQWQPVGAYHPQQGMFPQPLIYTHPGFGQVGASLYGASVQQRPTQPQQPNAGGQTSTVPQQHPFM